MRNVRELLTSEMSKEEWSQFRKDWIEEYSRDLRVECGMTDISESREIAEIRFESYAGQEGYTSRDFRIQAERERNGL